MARRAGFNSVLVTRLLDRDHLAALCKRRLSLQDRQTIFKQEIAGRVLAVEVFSEGQRPRAIAMEQQAPEVGDRVRDTTQLAAALGIGARDLGQDLPTRVVSTGAPHPAGAGAQPRRGRSGRARCRWPG
jgi:hypothetical protein